MCDSASAVDIEVPPRVRLCSSSSGRRLRGENGTSAPRSPGGRDTSVGELVKTLVIVLHIVRQRTPIT